MNVRKAHKQNFKSHAHPKRPSEPHKHIWVKAQSECETKCG